MPFEQQSASGRLVRGSTVSLSRVYPFCLFTVGSFLSVYCRVLQMELETILQHKDIRVKTRRVGVRFRATPELLPF